jgi:hypothetical protein
LIFSGGERGIAEMERRLRAGSVSAARVDQLLEQGLAWQERISQGGNFGFWAIGVLPVPSQVRTSGTFARETNWPRLLPAAFVGGYGTPEQKDHFVRHAITVEVLAITDGLLVQIVSLFGPQLSASIEADVLDTTVQMAAFHEMPGPRLRVWNWRFDAPVVRDTPVVIQWRIEASGALEALGVSGGELSGVIEAAWPQPADGPGPTLLRCVRPLE